MTDVFLKLLDMSLSACWLMAAILILRPLLRRFSSMLCMAAWALVAIRLLCPFTIESALSLIPTADPVSQVVYSEEQEPLYTGTIPYDADSTEDVPPVVTAPDSLTPNIGDSVDPMQVVTAAASVVWLVGIGGMLAYGAIGMVRVRRRTRTAVPIGDGALEGDDIGTPFIVGVFRPRIYIPSDLGEEERVWVIAHERSHIRWGDAVFKPLGFLTLCIHWFNPLVWVCYALFCRDMESACDERVIGNLNADDRKAYSRALVSCSRPRRMMLAPLAFGEVNVKSRIKNVLNFKRPALWIAIAACVLLAVAIPLWFCDPLSSSPSVDAALDAKLSQWIYEHHEGAYLEGDVNAENHYILDVKEDDYHTNVYMWVLYQEYDEQNGELVEVAGAHIPTVIVAHKMGDEYKLEEYWEPEDGDRYVPSIRERFPLRLWNKATDSQRYIEQQENACRAVARWQLQSTNDSDAVALYATVTDISGTLMTVIPHEGQTVSGEIHVSSEYLLDPAAIAVGDEIIIYYDGNVMETYPLQLSGIRRIVKVNGTLAPQTETSSVKQAVVHSGYPSKITEYYQVAMNADGTYYYIVWDENGQKMDEVKGLVKEPQVQKMSSDYVKAFYQRGAGASTSETIYYHIQSGLKSDPFPSVLHDTDDTVYYLEYNATSKLHRLVASGILPTSSYYESYLLEDAAIPDPVTDFRLLPTGQIRVSYRTNSGAEVTKIFGEEIPLPTLRGTVTGVYSALLKIMLDEGQEVSGEVQVYYTRADEDGIVVGDHVVVGYDGKINMSYPTQVTANSVMVE